MHTKKMNFIIIDVFLFNTKIFKRRLDYRRGTKRTLLKCKQVTTIIKDSHLNKKNKLALKRHFVNYCTSTKAAHFDGESL